MLESALLRKNKVNISDYNCQQDIENRILLSDFSAFDIEVLEEILFSPLKISVKKLSRNMGCQEEDLSSILQKLAKAGLLTIQEDNLLIDKETRKYFEFQMIRFSPSFKPDMEFLAGLLRKVPIHLLPTWYSIPRSSNNIFESIIEKHLLTPQIFQRYLLDLNLGDPIIHSIIADLFAAPDGKLFSSDVIAKYNLTRRHFEELLLLLEFNFIGCLCYEKEGDHWMEIITPFHEWRQYLQFLKKTEAPRLGKELKIIRSKENDFGFIEDMSALLQSIRQTPLFIGSWQTGEPLSEKIIKTIVSRCSALPAQEAYLAKILGKLLLIELAEKNGQKIEPSSFALEWLSMSLENRALHLYRHPKNQLLGVSLPSQILTERNVREAEKSIKRVLHGDWVFFDDFVKGVLVTLSPDSVIMLKKVGKHWSYTLPVYGEDEKTLIKATLFDWLFEAGMVAIGMHKNKECFSVTPFGRFCFEE